MDVDISNNSVDYVIQPVGSISNSQTSMENDNIEIINEKEFHANQKRRLNLLKRATLCPFGHHIGCACPLNSRCLEVKRLCSHNQCRDMINPKYSKKGDICLVGRCISSRFISSHFRRCTDLECEVCVPVREAIKQSTENKRQVVARHQNFPTIMNIVSKNTVLFDEE